jgi:hypothetical protein
MKWTDLNKVVWLSALALLASTCRNVGAADDPVAKLAWKDGVAKVAGKLADTDARDKVQKHFCKIYAVPLKAGTSYRIDMASKEIDSYLRLEDDAGKELANDDDSGGQLNARIVFECPKDGTYRVIATTFGGGTGAFELTVQSAVLAKSGPLAFKDSVIQVQSELTNDDPKDKVRTTSPCRIFTVKLAKGKAYQIDMTSNKIDSYLRLEDATGKQLAEDDDGGGFPNARIVFRCTADGAYKIIATSVGGGTGPFDLTVKAPEKVKTIALELKNGAAEVQAALAATDVKDLVRKQSVCKIYSVKLKAGKTYQIDMKSNDIDSYLRLEDSVGKQLAKDDDSGGGHDARIIFNCPADGVYRIIATTFGGETGPFVLAIKEM